MTGKTFSATLAFSFPGENKRMLARTGQCLTIEAAEPSGNALYKVNPEDPLWVLVLALFTRRNYAPFLSSLSLPKR